MLQKNHWRGILNGMNTIFWCTNTEINAARTISVLFKKNTFMGLEIQQYKLKSTKLSIYGWK